MFWVALAVLFAFQIVDIITKVRDQESIVGPVINIILLFIAGLAGGGNLP